MTKITSYNKSLFESIKRINEYGMEYWMARDLAKVLEYNRWENFVNVIEKAKEACENSNNNVLDHIADVSNMIEIGNGGKREVDDVQLSRYACYLIVQNSDPRKEVVALGQTYFAIQTRKQELVEDFEELDEDLKRLAVRNELKEHNKQLVAAAKTPEWRRILITLFFKITAIWAYTVG